MPPEAADRPKPARSRRLQPNGRVARVPCRGRGPDGGAPCERAKARAITSAPATACSRIRAQDRRGYLPAKAARKAKRHFAPIGDAQRLRLRPVRSHRSAIPTRNLHGSGICPAPPLQAAHAQPDGDRRDVPGTLPGAAPTGRLPARTVPHLPADGRKGAQRRGGNTPSPDSSRPRPSCHRHRKS